MRQYTTIILFMVILCACNSQQQKNQTSGEENLHAKQLLQGIWVDDDSETVLFKIQGDTIYYPEFQNAPVYFKIMNDTLYTFGNEQSRYKIDKQGESIFWFHSFSDNMIRLHRSEDENDTLAFHNRKAEVIATYTEMTKKDTVVMYNGIRYRAYVFVNPSSIPVTKTSYSEDGISVDNVYYDNVMHICVYEGKKSLYAKDITKQSFIGVIPDDFLQKSILSDMEFIGIDRSGYHYQATVCVPESYVCCQINLIISFDGELSMKAEN